MSYPEFFSENETILQDNNLKSFSDIWNLDIPWFEEPNRRREQFSGVVRGEFKDKDGNSVNLFIKRQQDFNNKSISHPFNGTPTFRREFTNLMRLNEAGMKSVVPIYYGESIDDGHHRAILITKELTGYVDAEEFFSSDVDVKLRENVLREAAYAIRQINNENYRHGSFYMKHVFIDTTNEEKPDICFIDFEKLRRQPFQKKVMLTDISRFIKKSPSLTNKDLESFVNYYLSGPGEDLTKSSLASKLHQLIKNRVMHDKLF